MTDVLSWIRLDGPFLIGHRGAPHAARENTLASFEAALEAGCDGVELDVHVTADGIPVVHHDEALRGEDGRRIVIAECSWTDLEGRFFGSGDETYPVHNLDEVLDTLNGRCLINVEIKPPGTDRLVPVAAAVIEALDRVRPRESVLVSSFDPELLGVIRWKDKSALLGFLFSAMSAYNHLQETEVIDGLTALHPRHDLVDSKFMKRVAERGHAVHTWTVDEAVRARELIELGVTSVITNRPEVTGPALYS